MMEEEILIVDTVNKKIKALGIELNAEPKDLKVLINGVDILKNIVVKELKIIKEVE